MMMGTLGFRVVVLEISSPAVTRRVMSPTRCVSAGGTDARPWPRPGVPVKVASETGLHDFRWTVLDQVSVRRTVPKGLILKEVDKALWTGALALVGPGDVLKGRYRAGFYLASSANTNSPTAIELAMSFCMACLSADDPSRMNAQLDEVMGLLRGFLLILGISLRWSPPTPPHYFRLPPDQDLRRSRSTSLLPPLHQKPLRRGVPGTR